MLNKSQKKILKKLLKEEKKLLKEETFNEKKKDNGKFTYGSEYDYRILKKEGLIEFAAIEKNKEFLAIDNIKLTTEGCEYINRTFLQKLFYFIKDSGIFVPLLVAIISGLVVSVLSFWLFGL